MYSGYYETALHNMFCETDSILETLKRQRLVLSCSGKDGYILEYSENMLDGGICELKVITDKEAENIKHLNEYWTTERIEDIKQKVYSTSGIECCVDVLLDAMDDYSTWLYQIDE